MTINLSRSIPLTEWGRVTVIGHTEERAQSVEFVLSHEAMIGFATELLWCYEDIDDSMKLSLCTHQLLVDPSPSQAVGFYLTPDSPMLMIKVNSLTEKQEDWIKYKNWKEIDIKRKNADQYYIVNEPSDEEIERNALESYELSRKNIMKITVFNEEGKNITDGCSTIIFEMNRRGMKDFATMLLVWANNYNVEKEYNLPHVAHSDRGYNLGLILLHNSISVKFRCRDLGTAHDYDSRF
ncbi:MAG: hypothetical protein NC489_26250 [Ruminococcus flavefaciens]|nr:hypothetical protein [Ruminococcus flavefaciens]